MRLSCSRVLFPLSIRRAALPLAIVPTFCFESPSREQLLFVSSFLFHQHKIPVRLVSLLLSYLSAIIKYFKLHLPFKWSIFLRKDESVSRNEFGENISFVCKYSMFVPFLWYLKYTRSNINNYFVVLYLKFYWNWATFNKLNSKAAVIWL